MVKLEGEKNIYIIMKKLFNNSAKVFFVMNLQTKIVKQSLLSMMEVKNIGIKTQIWLKTLEIKTQTWLKTLEIKIKTFNIAYLFKVSKTQKNYENKG